MPNHPRRAFTLVEMLVVIGIIAILSALLLPAVMMAMRAARNATIALELKQIDTAIESYRLEKGDYPPNFRNPEVVRRHIAKCYPRIDGIYLNAFMAKVFPNNPTTASNIPTPPSSATPGTLVIDDAESLVFWLSMTDTNEKYPFLSYMRWPITNNPAQEIPVNAKRYYDFDETRLFTSTGPTAATTVSGRTEPLKSFVAKFCQETCYIYIDARSYDRPLGEFWDLGRFGTDPVPTGSSYGSDTFAYSRATGGCVRPYWSASKNPNAATTAGGYRGTFKPVNSTTFQIICAGQDGDFGYEQLTDIDVKVYNTGENYTEGDKDNITNFSSGKTLNDAIP